MQDFTKNVAELRDTIRGLRSDLETAEKAAASQQQRADNLVQQLENAEKMRRQVVEGKTTMTNEILQLKESLSAAHGEISKLQKALDVQIGEVKRLGEELAEEQANRRKMESEMEATEAKLVRVQENRLTADGRASGALDAIQRLGEGLSNGL